MYKCSKNQITSINYRLERQSFIPQSFITHFETRGNIVLFPRIEYTVNFFVSSFYKYPFLLKGQFFLLIEGDQSTYTLGHAVWCKSQVFLFVPLFASIWAVHMSLPIHVCRNGKCICFPCKPTGSLPSFLNPLNACASERERGKIRRS